MTAKFTARITPKVDLVAGTICIEEMTTTEPRPAQEIIGRFATRVINTRDKAIRDALICLGWRPPAEPLPQGEQGEQTGGPSLSLSADAHTRARSSDPATSAAAARRAALFAGAHATRVLAALRQHEVMTARTIAELTGLTVVQVCRRLPELERDGHIRRQQMQTPLGLKDLEIDGFTAWRLG